MQASPPEKTHYCIFTQSLLKSKKVQYPPPMSGVSQPFPNAVLLLYCVYCLSDDNTWESRILWHGFEKNKQTAVTCVWKEKKYCSCYIILIKADTILSKNIYNNFQNLLFKKLLANLGNRTDIWKFYLPADTFWLPKTVERVLGYTTGCWSITFLS